MSLFPAYSQDLTEQNKEIINETKKLENDNQNWLENSSYQEVSVLISNLPDDDEWIDSSEDETCSKGEIKNDETVEIKQIHKEKRHKKKRDHYKHSDKNERDDFFEDKHRNKMFASLDTLSHKMRPNYKLSGMKIGLNYGKNKKRKNFSRYHEISNKKKKKKENILEFGKDTVEIMDFIKAQEDDIEKKLKDKTEDFNKKLAENPKDISMWIDYMNFQDQIIQVQKFSKINDSKHLLYKKKLSIIEKALIENSDSSELFKLKMQILAQLLPVDEFSTQIQEMIEDDPKNFVLWQVLIFIIQTSCSLCNVSTVLEHYVKCFAVLKQKSRADAKFYDEQVLSLLFQCLTFLRHAGLWEQMWEIIKINLCLNLTIEFETFENINVIDEKYLMEMEDLILATKLPLNQLWFRIESLRERCYWTGIDIKKADLSLIGDEKRLVSADETNDFIYPTISRKSNFRIAVLSILSLKVPLLPSRHYTLKDFKLDELYWSVDSLEFILPMIYPTIWLGDSKHCMFSETVLKNLLEANLTSGPQVLKFHPAQELYLDFLRTVFKIIADKLVGDEKISIYIWWLKFEKLLVFMTKYDPLREKNRNKKLKTLLKNFLKEPENRNNLHYYREFAMIEYELGNIENCILMLKKTILLQDFKNLNFEERIALFSLYRTILETLLNSNFSENLNLETFKEIVESLKNFMATCYKHDSDLSVNEMLYNEILKFFSTSLEDEPEESFLLPNIHCDILICYTYLMYSESTDNIEDMLELFDRFLSHTSKCFRLHERLYETKTCFLQFCHGKGHSYNENLKNTINDAVQIYPNNFFFLTIHSTIKIEEPIWKSKIVSDKFNIWSVIALCLTGRARIDHWKKMQLEENHTAMINKMLAFHQKVSRTQEVQGCPLIWRFYILLIQENDLSIKKGEEIYYEAVSQCPWARSIYIAAAEIAPQNLPQIQEIIKEKELRMHIILEELEILTQE